MPCDFDEGKHSGRPCVMALHSDANLSTTCPDSFRWLQFNELKDKLFIQCKIDR